MADFEITPEVASFLSQRFIGRLATASRDGQPHVVPVWFLWEEGAAWISSYKSTRKVIDIENNNKCAMVVDLENVNEGLKAVAIEGLATLVTTPNNEVKERIERVYLKYLGQDGVNEAEPQSWLNSPENVLIKLVPTRIKTW